MRGEIVNLNGVACRQGGWKMLRIVIDIDGDDDFATKEAVAMRLEPFGKIRVVSVSNGKEIERRGAERHWPYV
jgi:hypothetical protein